MDNKNSLKNKNWDNISKILSILAILLGGFYFIFSNFINIQKPQLTYNIITSTPLIELKEDIKNLKIKYDSIDLNKVQKNISVVVLEIKNEGTKNITINDFDVALPFGLKFSNSSLLNEPELIKSSDQEYFSNIIQSFSGNSIELEKKIIDKDEFLFIKFYLIHNDNVKPIIESTGKISGQRKIEVLEKKKDFNDSNNLNQLTNILSTALITILTLLTLSLYKNNNIRLKTNNKLLEKNQELSAEISKLKQ